MRKLTIIGAPACNFVWSVCIAAEEKGVAYDLAPAQPHGETVLEIHPLGLIPVMRHGDAAVCESRSIARYIDDVFDGPALFPREPAQRARIESWVSLCNTTVHPVISTYVVETMAQAMFNRPTDEAKKAEALDALPHLLDAVAGGLTDARYLGSNEFTYADANVAPMLYYVAAQSEGAELVAHRDRVRSYLDAMLARPSVARTTP